jgi:hypothetical protein
MGDRTVVDQREVGHDADRGESLSSPAPHLRAGL